MRLASAVAIALVACGNSSKATIEFVEPDALADSVMLVRSETFVVVGDEWRRSGRPVRVLSASSFEEVVKTTGDPIWAGRVSGGDTVLLVDEPEASPLVLARADQSDKLVVVPPSESGWRLAYRECGTALCSFSWEEDASKKQHVDVVSMTSLERVAAYERPAATRPGVTDPVAEVTYRLDKSMRVFAENQRTGETRWTTFLDVPSTRKEFNLDEVGLLVTGRGRYVLAVYGSSRHGEFLSPELTVLDAATGDRVAVDQARFAQLADRVMRYEVVPGVDNLLAVSLSVQVEGWESRDTGLVSVKEVTIPALTTIASHDVPKGHWLRGAAPRQIVPLSSKRVLLAPTRFPSSPSPGTGRPKAP